MNYMYVKKNSHNNTHVERSILSGNKHPYSTIQFNEIKLLWIENWFKTKKKQIREEKLGKKHSREK